MSHCDITAHENGGAEYAVEGRCGLRPAALMVPQSPSMSLTPDACWNNGLCPTEGAREGESHISASPQHRPHEEERVWKHCICGAVGLDVHKASLTACVRLQGDRGKLEKYARRFSTMTADLRALAAWLIELRVTHVAMESTGVYWKPVWNILEGNFTLILAHAQHVKNVPGRKTDQKDAEWLAELLQHGLLPSSFVPPRLIRDLRDLTRARASLAQESSRLASRIQKVLEDAN